MKCLFCAGEFLPREKSKSHQKRYKFCSRKCADTFRRGKKFKLSKESIEKIRKWHTGKKFSDETKQKMRLKKLGTKQTLEHKEKIRLAQIKRVKEGRHNNYKGGITNYERKLYLVNRRRALRHNAKGCHTQDEWEILKAQYNWMCPSCKKQEPDIKLTEDHIIPLSKGGSDNIENIQPLCKSCNSKKHTKIIKY